jgi:glycosyltransferase involved in cell wall biosynthesis
MNEKKLRAFTNAKRKAARKISEALESIQEVEQLGFEIQRRKRYLEAKQLLVCIIYPLERLLGLDFKKIQDKLPRALPKFLEVLSLINIPVDTFCDELIDLQSRLQKHPEKPKTSVDPNPSNKTKDRLDILFASSMFCSNKHGGGQRLFDIVSDLSIRHNIDMYSCYNPDLDEESFGHIRNRFRNLRLVHGHQMSSSDILEWLKGNKKNRKSYDIIHFEYPESVPLMNTLKPFGKKNIFTLIECVTLHQKMAFGKRIQNRSRTEDLTRDDCWVLYRLLHAAFLEAKAVQECDECIAVTSEDARFARKYFGYQPKVIPAGISESFFNDFGGKKIRLKKSQLKTVAFMGFYGHPPNIEGINWYLDHVHPKLKSVPNYRLSIIGGGNPDFINNLRTKYKDDSTVNITGYIQDIGPILLQNSICIAPLFSGAGIRCKLHQYAALSKPIVSTSLAAVGTVYKNKESIFICDNSESFQKALLTLFDDPDLQSKTGRAAQNIVKEFYLSSKLTKKIEELYE